MKKLNNSRKKIYIITGSRSEYGYLKNLITKFKTFKKFNFKIIVTGSHLSKKHGYTINEIKKDKFKIYKKINILDKNDNNQGVLNSISKGLIKFSKLIQVGNPDLVILFGDRFEILSASIASMVLRIPIIHIHGGEATEGLIDEPIRHSISKMSHVHFVATNEYRKRVIQLGENPNKVFCVGALCLDAIKSTELMNKNDLERELNFKSL